MTRAPRSPLLVGSLLFVTLGILAPSVATWAADPADEENAYTIVSGGTQFLPMSGLVIDLPVVGTNRYSMWGRWSLEVNGESNARDVIDEQTAGGQTLVAGTWVFGGTFTAGGCDKVVESEDLEGAWPAEQIAQWGLTWQVRGGVYDFANTLGKHPAVILCASNGDGPQLLLYHFFIDRTTMSHDEMIVAMRGQPTIAAIAESFRAARSGAVTPLHRRDVRNTGTRAAFRVVDLPQLNLRLTLPDDGFLWSEDLDDGNNVLDRRVPIFPDVSVELARIERLTCAEAYEDFTLARDPATRPINLPSGWEAGPALVLDDGRRELIACRPVAGSVIAVGMVTTSPDFRALRPLLEAITRAPTIR